MKAISALAAVGFAANSQLWLNRGDGFFACMFFGLSMLYVALFAKELAL